jgi:hypothetical protein
MSRCDLVVLGAADGVTGSRTPVETDRAATDAFRRALRDTFGWRVEDPDLGERVCLGLRPIAASSRRSAALVYASSSCACSSWV